MPALNIGMFGNEGSDEPCWLRGSVFMDYGELYLLDPPAGAQGRRQFWGAGWAVTANIGSHLDARLSMAFPLDFHAANPRRRCACLFRRRRAILNCHAQQHFTNL